MNVLNKVSDNKPVTKLPEQEVMRNDNDEQEIITTEKIDTNDLKQTRESSYSFRKKMSLFIQQSKSGVTFSLDLEEAPNWLMMLVFVFAFLAMIIIVSLFFFFAKSF